MKLWKKNLPYKYNPNCVLGEHNITDVTKEFAEEMGFDQWQKCTNHSNRKLGISTVVSNAATGIQHIVSKAARHKDVNTHKKYFKESADTMQSYNKAMTGRHVPLRNNSPQSEKQKPEASPTTSPVREMKKVKVAEVQLKKEEDNLTIAEHATIDLPFDPDIVTASDMSKAEPPSQIILQTKSSEDVVTQNYNESDTLAKEFMPNAKPKIPPLPLVTPHDTFHAVVTQQHLNNIQCHIYYGSDTHNPTIIPQTTHAPYFPMSATAANTMSLLHHQISCMQQQIQENEKRNYQEQIATYKEKYNEAMWEAREARRDEKIQQALERPTYMCMIL
jgi:hypothetical protein